MHPKCEFIPGLRRRVFYFSLIIFPYDFFRYSISKWNISHWRVIASGMEITPCEKKKKENSRTLIFRIFINEFAKVKAIRSTRNNSQEFHSVLRPSWKPDRRSWMEKCSTPKLRFKEAIRFQVDGMGGNGRSWQWRRIEIDYSRYAHLPTHPLTHLPFAPAPIHLLSHEG